ncbi:ABC transporter permease [Salinarimonas ramus]|uniref:ABC transporter permease n=1 Tax=Salinarimonas ramus TaxID=690164 RepID=A0A917Q3M4_9HYPH|nr:ABC transporter permease subunit [Salinarimonas ramus]GGK17981.1 ABC transporter permease [Salinarimonas ramus]
MTTRPDVLRAAPALTLALFLVPIGAGLLGTLAPAFGVLPAIGESGFTLDAWRTLAEQPGIDASIRLTLTSGLLSTALALVFACGFAALASSRPGIARLERALAPLLATPHVAVAIGLAFLVASSGLLVRVVSPWLTGWERPPALAIVRDPYGLSYVAGLAIKETAFLVLMVLAAQGQVRAAQALAAARALGYAPLVAWAKVVLPAIYRQIRLPVYAVLAFSLSNVEVALVLAPGTPPPLAVLAMRWFSSWDLSLYPVAAAAATLQLAVVVAGIGAWRVAEAFVKRIHRAWCERGRRTGLAGPVLALGGAGGVVSGVAILAAIGVMALWSIAENWRYPDALPRALSLRTWERALPTMSDLVSTTAAIAAAASLLAVILALACLENEARRDLKPGARALWLLYVPLLVPQIAFLFGAQVALVRLDLDGTLTAVIWAHLLFVLPYVFLSLADPFRALDPRYARIAAGLGASPWRTFFTVKLPMLARPVATAFAVGFSVSVALYLPTLFAGAGRIMTLTTEAVTLSSGADRRVVGVTAFLQAALPLLVYAAALAGPGLIAARRRRVTLREGTP